MKEALEELDSMERVSTRASVRTLSNRKNVCVLEDVEEKIFLGLSMCFVAACFLFMLARHFAHTHTYSVLTGHTHAYRMDPKICS